NPGPPLHVRNPGAPPPGLSSGPQLRSIPCLTRRSFLSTAGAAGVLAVLAVCSQYYTEDDLTFYQAKLELNSYFYDLLARFRSARPQINVQHDISSNLSAGFVRHSPPDLGCLNYNFEIARFVEAGALSDLADLPSADRVNPDLLPLIKLTAYYPGRTSVIPYSLMAASVLYNRDIF